MRALWIKFRCWLDYQRSMRKLNAMVKRTKLGHEHAESLMDQLRRL